MIIKKPYAFLIKHFRLIHFILFILTVYLTYKSHKLFIFFNNYANNGSFIYFDNLNTMYIGLFVFISIIIIMLLSTIVYLLMKWKNKSRKLYIFTFAFYFILFISLLIYFNILGGLTGDALDVRTLRIYRDMTLIMYIPQYLFDILLLVRATGFNIEKFNFKKDLEELDIAEEDQEEIEVTISNDTYKIPRFFRKQLHEIKYYFKENKIYFYILLIILFVSISFITYKELKGISSTYYESEYFDINGISFTVDSSYVTNVDYKGNILDKDKYYLITKVLLENTSNVKKVLNTNELRLSINDNNYYPIYSINEYFKDLGEGYYKNVIYIAEKNYYLIIYEIPSNIDYSNAYLRLLINTTSNKSDIVASYKNVKLNPKEYFLEKEFSYYNIKDEINFNNTTLKETNFIVNNYSINDIFTENYEYCVSSCYNGKKIIKPDLLIEGDKTILKLETDLVLDNSLYINKYINTNSDFINYFGTLAYTVNGNLKNININVFNLGNIKTNNVYLIVPKEIKNASDISLVLIIRNKKFIIKIK